MNHADYLALRDSMRSIYVRCSTGGESPKLAIMNGGDLNRMLKTDEFDPAAAYHVSESGFSRVELPEE